MKVSIFFSSLSRKQKELLLVELSGTLLAVSSKFLLALGFPIAWIISALGFIFVIYFNYREKLKVMNVAVSFLFFASLYGFYKSFIRLKELTNLDWVVIVITVIIAIYFIKSQFKRKEVSKKIMFYQITAMIATIVAFVLIGLKFDFGWIVLFCGHIMVFLLYKNIPNSKIFTYAQVLSAIIASIKILEIYNLVYFT